MSVGALITWPYKAGGRSRRGLPKAGTTVLLYDLLKLKDIQFSFEKIQSKIACRRLKSTIVMMSSKDNMSSLDDTVTIVEFHRRHNRSVNRCRVA